VEELSEASPIVLVAGVWLCPTAHPQQATTVCCFLAEDQQRQKTRNDEAVEECTGSRRFFEVRQ